MMSERNFRATLLHKINVLRNELRYRLDFKSHFSNLMQRLFRSMIFRESWQEKYGRQTFFYNAFKALSFNGISGDYAEFGCCGGMTFGMAYQEATRHGHAARLWAFDSFQGLPPQAGAKDEHAKWIAGNMKTSLDQFHKVCAKNGIPGERYSVVSGFYDETLPKLSNEEAPADIALVYIDCDLYSSTQTVLEFLSPRIKHGLIIAFDDYFCFSASQIAGERRAMLEFFAKHTQWELVPHMQFGWHGQSFVIEDRRLTERQPRQGSGVLD